MVGKNWIRVGHRGAPREYPANTLRGFARAVEWGCDMVECDVRAAADGVLVLAHDPEVTDAGGRRWEIARHSSDDLRGLDLGAGEGVPTLDDLVAWSVRSGVVAVMADMKCEGNGVEEKVAAALAPLPPERKIVPGASPAARERFRRADPLLRLSLSLGDTMTGAEFDALLPTIDTGAVTWQYPLLSAGRIAALHARGLTVFAWTVDDPAIMRRLLADGVDGIISNRADLLQEASL